MTFQSYYDYYVSFGMISKQAPESTVSIDPTAQVMAIRYNDEKTIRDIYTDNYPQAERYIMQNNGSQEEAQDIYQEAFIAVWRNIKLDKFVPQHENSLKQYLLQVVKHKWLDHLRSARHRNTVPLYEQDVNEEIDLLPAEQNEKINSVKEHFQKLGDVCRELLSRFYYKKESMRKISEAFNWTEATARNNKYRCVEKLRQSLQTK